ncbi:MAG: hypothetical protein NVS3B15_12610 [Sediminibacterium sp.]
MIVTVIGPGLIGGSMALALKGKGFADKVIGVETNEEHRQKALLLGLVDEVSELEPAVLAASLIILATPLWRKRCCRRYLTWLTGR